MIHLFNTSSSRVTVMVNEGLVAPPRQTSPATDYAPNSTRIPIEKFRKPSIFALGKNKLHVVFSDLPKTPEATYFLSLTGTSISETYLLFMFENGFWLMRSSGEIVKVGYN